MVRAGQRERSGGLDHHLHALGEEPQRLDELRVGHGDDLVHQPLDDGEGDFPGRLGLRAVGDGAGRLDAHDVPGAQRLLHIVAGLRLHADHLAARRQLFGREQAARQQAAAAQADEEVVQPGHVFQQLHRGRALAGDDVGMVEGRHEHHAALRGQAPADGLAVFAEAVVGDHLGPVFARGGHLGGGCVLGHDDHRGHVEQAGRERDRLGMVAGGEGQHAALALGGVQLHQGVVGAAELEGPHALEVLALEEELGAQGLVGGARAQHGGAVGDARQAPGRGGDVVVGGRGRGMRFHGASSRSVCGVRKGLPHHRPGRPFSASTGSGRRSPPIRSAQFAEALHRCQVGEVARAPFAHRGNGFAHVAVAPHRSLQPAHLAQAVVHGVVACVVHRLLGAPDGHRRLGGDLARTGQGRFQHGLVRGEHFVHQPAGQGAGRGQAPAGVGQLLDDAQRDQLGQALQRAYVGHHADIDLLDAEERVLGGVADAGGRHHVHRAADAAAVDRGDNRDAQRFDAGEGGLHVGQQVEDGGAAFGALVVHGDGTAEGFQRHAGREMPAGAADDQRPCLARAVDPREHGVQLAPEGGVHGVERLRAIEHQVRDVARDGQAEAGEGGGVGHAAHSRRDAALPAVTCATAGSAGGGRQSGEEHQQAAERHHGSGGGQQRGGGGHGCLAAVELGQHERPRAGGQGGQQHGHVHLRRGQLEHGLRQPPRERRQGQQLGGRERQGGAVTAALAVRLRGPVGHEGTQADQGAGRGGLAEHVQEGVHAAGQGQAGGREARAQQGREHDGVAQRSREGLRDGAQARRVAAQAHFHQHHGQREQHADHEDGGHGGFHLARLAEHQQAQRQADVGGVGVRRRHRIHARVRQVASAAQSQRQHGDEHGQRGDAEGGDEPRLPQLRPGTAGHDAEEGRGQGQPHHEPVDGAGGRGIEHPGAPGEVAGGDEGEQGQQDGQGGGHGTGVQGCWRMPGPRSVPSRAARLGRRGHTVQYHRKTLAIPLGHHAGPSAPALLPCRGGHAAFRAGGRAPAHFPAAAEPADRGAGGGTGRAVARAQSPRRGAHGRGPATAGGRARHPGVRRARGAQCTRRRRGRGRAAGDRLHHVRGLQRGARLCAALRRAASAGGAVAAGGGVQRPRGPGGRRAHRRGHRLRPAAAARTLAPHGGARAAVPGAAARPPPGGAAQRAGGGAGGRTLHRHAAGRGALAARGGAGAVPPGRLRAPHRHGSAAAADHPQPGGRGRGRGTGAGLHAQGAAGCRGVPARAAGGGAGAGPGLARREQQPLPAAPAGPGTGCLTAPRQARGERCLSGAPCRRPVRTAPSSRPRPPSARC